MKFGLLLAILIALVVAAAAVLPKLPKRPKKGNFAKRKALTANEQAMYWRLADCFPMPDQAVLAQVSFGALLQAKGGASRYSFSQKIADFVLMSKGFEVIAVIELDDASHKGREANDADRDAMLIEAGYKVLRYKRVPDRAQLMEDIASFKAPTEMNSTS